MSFLKRNNTQRDIEIFIKSNKLSNLYNSYLFRHRVGGHKKIYEGIYFVEIINNCIENSNKKLLKSKEKG